MGKWLQYNHIYIYIFIYIYIYLYALHPTDTPLQLQWLQRVWKVEVETSNDSPAGESMNVCTEFHITQTVVIQGETCRCHRFAYYNKVQL
jgi:hypothetical protein